MGCESTNVRGNMTIIHRECFAILLLILLPCAVPYVTLHSVTRYTKDFQLQSFQIQPAIEKFSQGTLIAKNNNLLSITKDGPNPYSIDPFSLISTDLTNLSSYINEIVKIEENPILSMAASHFFRQKQGKRFRPAITTLIGKALSRITHEQQGYEQSPLHQLHLQLGKITEMIHVASLIHDDIIDDAEMRRGGAAVHTLYTNKVAVLAGDFLLARASLLLARLNNVQVVEFIATALDELVQGEILQAKTKGAELLHMNSYLRKTYFKTSSLICRATTSIALLSGYDYDNPYTVAVEKYGYHVGMAYQIVDDILDFTGATQTLGKPAQTDMTLGLATAPMLFAAQHCPSLHPLITRKFQQAGDIEKAVTLARQTDCIAQSYAMAEEHIQSAQEAILMLPPSIERDALIQVLYLVISRNK